LDVRRYSCCCFVVVVVVVAAAAEDFDVFVDSTQSARALFLSFFGNDKLIGKGDVSRFDSDPLLTLRSYQRSPLLLKDPIGKYISQEYSVL
jgi:hypothetical protein